MKRWFSLMAFTLVAAVGVGLLAPAPSQAKSDNQPRYGWCRDGLDRKKYACPPPQPEEPPEACHCFLSGIKVYGCVPGTACAVCCEPVSGTVAEQVNTSLGDDVKPCPLKETATLA